MDSYELNKILGAVLFSCLCLLTLNIAAGTLFAPQKPAKPGYEIAVQEQPAGGKEAPEAPSQPIEVLLASSSAERGESAAKACQACHTFEKGGAKKIGPNLWNIVNRPKASQPDFNYSAAMKAKGGAWTFEELNNFLTNPRKYIAGTSMSYAGISRDTQRADVINYLHTLSDKPVDLPKAAEKK